MQTINLSVQNYFSLVRMPLPTESFYLLTTLFDFSVHFILIVLCVAVLIYFVRNLHLAFLFASSILYCAVLVFLMKSFINISRPSGAVILALDSSFPSGHTAVAVVFFMMLIYIFRDSFKGIWKIVFNSLCIALMFLVSFSRLYLGVHWLSDIIFGLIFGLFVSWLSVFIFNHLFITGKDKIMIK